MTPCVLRQRRNARRAMYVRTLWNIYMTSIVLCVLIIIRLECEMGFGLHVPRGTTTQEGDRNGQESDSASPELRLP